MQQCGLVFVIETRVPEKTLIGFTYETILKL